MSPDFSFTCVFIFFKVILPPSSIPEHFPVQLGGIYVPGRTIACRWRGLIWQGVTTSYFDMRCALRNRWEFRSWGNFLFLERFYCSCFKYWSFLNKVFLKIKSLKKKKKKKKSAIDFQCTEMVVCSIGKLEPCGQLILLSWCGSNNKNA